MAILAAVPALAQGEYLKHNFSVGAGGAVPTREIGPLLAAQPALWVGYGYRFMKNFQVETGLNTVFHAAKVRDFYDSDFGPLRIRDYQYMLTLGGRVIVPAGRERVQLSFGGGGSYLRYQEFISQPFDDYGPRIGCPVCGHRAGWGYYALAGVSVGVDRMRRYRIGATTRVFRARVGGDPLGAVPGFRTSDAWVSTAGEFSVTF
jgi:hypothetical protein